MAAGINGSTILLQVRTATGPDVYTTVGGQRDLSVSKGRTSINTSDKADGDSTGLAGRRETSITMEGLVIASDVGRAALVAAYEGDGVVRVRRTAIGAEAAKQLNGYITSLDEDFPDDDVSTWTVEVQGNGGWTAVS